MKPRDDLNRKLCALLNIKVFDHPAMTATGFINPHIKGADGRAAHVPDFLHDLSTTVRHLPKTVQFHLRFSRHLDAWCCLLSDVDTGVYFAEAFGDTEAEAVALAFEQYLVGQSVRLHGVTNT